MLDMECSESVNMMFWNTVFIRFYPFLKGVPFEGVFTLRKYFFLAPFECFFKLIVHILILNNQSLFFQPLRNALFVMCDKVRNICI
ncbi:hypothetical protein DKP85_12990 [Bacillus thuringiensis]|nr:hypothetical protein [Bacillus toyonensis biovar Thuringiensis]